ncbi:N-acetylglucosaminidase [Sporosarcina sp.]|uniref:N-acetylglucosaminidase n=1 Tax=Sporosarcina sp. TaxID=49982 RepID=UPI00262CF24E|nr:glucosaminidase domain-containing protein [Sporosarcina sp.]
MKFLKPLIATSLAALVVMISFSLNAGAATVWPHVDNVEPTKTWKISFNKPVDRKTVTNKSIYITDSKGIKLSNVITFSNSDETVQILPPSGNYRAGETYTIHITPAVENRDGKALKEGVTKTFTIEKVTYDLANVQTDGTVSIVRKFTSFEEAASQMTQNQAVLKSGMIVHMPSGLVSTKSANGSSLTILHSDKLLKKEVTYVAADTELLYVNSTDAYVEVELAGVNYYITHDNSRLLPGQTVKKRSYYYTANGSLFHSIYSHNAGSTGVYEVGLAPRFMQDGVHYYSTDGSRFTNAAGQQVGTAHQYFQYLPMRSKTQYTAEELDAYILARLRQLEQNSSTAIYKDASVKSKLIGLGAELKRVEKEYHVNALHILALAQNESQYGMSAYAQKYNNIFGLYVTDDNPSKKEFTTVNHNIEELVNVFLNRNYLPPTGGYANGTNFGNKAVGVNVKYASDPYWGAKNAGHMYRIDRMMGGRELANQAKIGLTNINEISLKFRRDPSTSQQYAYSYPKSGMPMIILDDQLKEAPWIKVRSDYVPYDELFVHGSYVGRLEW